MAKKTFKNDINPAMSFISQESVARTEEKPRLVPPKAPEGYKLNPLYVETKSRRLQLLLQPSLYDKLKARATAEGASVNAVVNAILQDALEEE